jgi:AcrR family transcriptional regulator
MAGAGKGRRKRWVTEARSEVADPATAEKRRRILTAAFAAFMELGYSDTSTLEIASRAKVSKRELYALVGSKEDLLVASISERVTRMRSLPADTLKLRDRESLRRMLDAFGARLLTEATHPAVVGVHRLAIAEANRAPEVARLLQSTGRQAIRAALKSVLVEARSAGLITGDPAELCEQFMGLLWGDLMINLLLRSVETPDPAEIKRRAASAALSLMKLHEN